MPKRYTDTQKWSDPWFRKLKPKLKLLWQYLCDNCDNCGMWKEDLDLASFNIGDKITLDDLGHLNNGKNRVINTDKGYWLIKDFIHYQIGKLEGDKLTNLQKNCKALIEQYLIKGVDILNYSIATGNDTQPFGYNNKIKIKGIEDKGKDIIIKEFFNYFLLKTKRAFKLTPDCQELIKKRFKDGYTLDQLKKAVDNFVLDTWEGRPGHMDLIYCIGKQKGKPDALEKWLNAPKIDPMAKYYKKEK